MGFIGFILTFIGLAMFSGILRAGRSDASWIRKLVLVGVAGFLVVSGLGMMFG